MFTHLLLFQHDVFFSGCLRSFFSSHEDGERFDSVAVSRETLEDVEMVSFVRTTCGSLVASRACAAGAAVRTFSARL